MSCQPFIVFRQLTASSDWKLKLFSIVDMRFFGVGVAREKITGAPNTSAMPTMSDLSGQREGHHAGGHRHRAG